MARGARVTSHPIRGKVMGMSADIDENPRRGMGQSIGQTAHMHARRRHFAGQGRTPGQEGRPDVTYPAHLHHSDSEVIRFAHLISG